MKLLDLYCGAGGAGQGYADAGFDVTGVDNRPQKNYPFKFVLGDALEYLKEHGHGYDVIHASPPCQAYSSMTKRWGNKQVDKHPRMIPAVRSLLKASGKYYIIENVGGARKELINPVMLCGSMFGLQTKQGSQLRRHRLFECNFPVEQPKCRHRKGLVIGVYGNTGGSSKRDGTQGFGVQDRRDAMGIQWMTGQELTQAIPPAYTNYIAKHLFKYLKEIR